MFQPQDLIIAYAKHLHFWHRFWELHIAPKLVFYFLLPMRNLSLNKFKRHVIITKKHTHMIIVRLAYHTSNYIHNKISLILKFKSQK